MTLGMDSINAEEVIFFIDLTSDYISKDILIKLIKVFIEDKKKFSEGNSFGLVMLQEEYNPVFVYDQTDVEVLTSIIDVKWQSRPTDQSYIENGLFEVLSYIFYKSRTVKKVYRVIVISDTPTERSDEYHQAIYNLILKSKRFSTIIDIIRVGDQESYDDDVKLNVITSETHGGLFHCTSNQFHDVLGSLIKNKKEFNVIQSATESGQIVAEDKIFYERLAVDLISLSVDDEEICDICQFEVCPVCEAFSDEIHKCYNCGTRYHSCCIARFSISNNIGFKHIFRCPKCQNLLKIDEDYVELIYEEEFKGLEVTNELVLKEAGEYGEQYEIDQEPTVQEIIPEEKIEEKVEESSIEEFEEAEITLEDLDAQIEMTNGIIETMSSIEEEAKVKPPLEKVIPIPIEKIPPIKKTPPIEQLEPIPIEKIPPIKKTPPLEKIVPVPIEKIPPIKKTPPLEKVVPIPIEKIPPIKKLEPIPKVKKFEPPLPIPTIEEEVDIEKSIEKIKRDLIEPPPPPPPTKKVRIGGYFGHDVDMSAPIKKGKKTPIKILDPQLIEEKKSIVELKPPRKRPKMKFCKICGATVKNIIECPNCGAPID